MDATTAPRPVFVPGVGATPFAFAHQSEVFEGAVFHTLPGHGDDRAPLEGVPAHAEYLLASLAEVPRPRVLIGHSLGAAIALEALSVAPDAADGVVVIAAGAQMPISEDTMDRCRDDFDAEVERLAAESFATGDPVALGARAEELRGVGRDALLADYRACAEWTIPDGLAGAQLPTLIIGASDDHLCAQGSSETLARGLPMAQMVVVEGAGHMVHLERPDAVNLLIAGYLARLELTLGGY